MNKKLLSTVGIFLVGGTLGVFILTLILNVTGMSNYKSHVVRYFEDEKHLGAVWTGKDYTTYLASRNGQVDAVNLPQTFKMLSTSYQLYQDVTLNMQGNQNGIAVAMADTGCQVVIGGTCTDCQDVAISGTSTEKCNMDAAFYNNVLPGNVEGTIDLTAGLEPGSAGLWGIANSISQEAYTQSTYLANVNYFTNDALEQIPLVGTDNVYAANLLWKSGLTDVSLGEPFFELWKAVRNLTYYLIVIPTIAFGFAIMFRVQIDNQTQITLMRAIPRLLVVILLITFSYPILALMVQASEPVADVGIQLIKAFGQAISPDTAVDDIAFKALGFLVFNMAFGSLPLTGGVLVGVIILLALLVTFLIAFFRWIFVSVITIIKIGFLIGFSPLILLFAAFPGREGIIKQFFINAASEIFGLSVISVMFAASFFVATVAGNYFVASLNNINNLWIGFIFLGASFGILWKAPSGPKMLKQVMGAQSLFSSGEEKRR